MLDIRIPIGLLFAVIGLLTTIYGFTTMNNIEMYTKSFGININLLSGAFMLVFGILMLALAKFKKR